MIKKDLRKFLVVLLFFVFVGNVTIHAATDEEPKILYEEMEHFELIEKVYSNIISNYPDANQSLDSLLKTAIEAEKLNEYKRAKNAYQEMIQQDPYAPLVSQVQLDLTRMDILSSLKSDNDAATDAAINKLLSEFSNNERIAEVLHHTAYRCRLSDEHNKADQLDGFVIKTWPQSDYALWAHMDKTEFNIDLGNMTVAQGEIDRLLANYSQHPRIAEALHHIAVHCQQLRKYDRAQQLDEYVIANWPASIFAMWAQMDIAIFNADQGNYEAADEAVTKLVNNFTSQPRIAEAVYDVALHYHNLKKYDKALQLNKYVISRWPTSVSAMWAQMDIAQISADQGNEAAADAAVAKLLANFSSHPLLAEAAHNVAYHYQQLYKYDKARQLHQYIINKWPENKSITVLSLAGLAAADIALGDEASARLKLDNLIANYKDHPDLSEAVYIIGEGCYELGRLKKKEGLKNESDEYFRKSIAIWGRIINELPFSLQTQRAWFFSGAAYTHLQDPGKALAIYQKVVNEWPDYEYAWNAQAMIGFCYEKLAESGLISESEAGPKFKLAYKNTIEKYPKCSLAQYAYLRLAKSASKKSQWSEAAGYYETLINKYPADGQNMFYLYSLGRIYKQMGNLERAAKIDQILAQQGNPKNRYVKKTIFKLAKSAYRESQWNEAAGYYETLLSNSPDDKGSTTILYYLGRTYEQMGRLEQATQIYQQLVQQGETKNRHVRGTISRLAKLAYKNGQWEKAAGYYETFLNNYPDDKKYMVVLYSLGRVYEQIDKSEQAAQIYQLIVQQGDPEDRHVIGSMRRLELMEGVER